MHFSWIKILQIPSPIQSSVKFIHQRCLILIQTNLSIFSFVCAFEVLFKKIFTILRLQRSGFSSINLIVLPFSVGSLIHSEPTSVWCQVGIKLYYFSMYWANFPNTSSKQPVLFHWFVGPPVSLVNFSYIHGVVFELSVLFQFFVCSCIKTTFLKKTITFNMS